jgi:hypothetical protein
MSIHNIEPKHVLRRNTNTSGTVMDVTAEVQTRHFPIISENNIYVPIPCYRALDVKLTDSPGKKNPITYWTLSFIIVFTIFFFNGPSSPFRAQASYSVPWSFFTVGRTPWTSDQLVARPLPKHRTTQTQNKRIHTPNIHALSGIRTNDPSVLASNESSCLRPRGYCDLLVFTIYRCKIQSNPIHVSRPSYSYIYFNIILRYPN